MRRRRRPLDTYRTASSADFDMDRGGAFPGCLRCNGNLQKLCECIYFSALNSTCHNLIMNFLLNIYRAQTETAWQFLKKE